MTGPLKNIEQAAEWLGIPAETLSKLVSARKVPFTRPGGGKHVRFSDEHLAAIVAAGEEWPDRTPAVLDNLVPLRTHPPAGPSTPPPPPGPSTPSKARRSA